MDKRASQRRALWQSSSNLYCQAVLFKVLLITFRARKELTLLLSSHLGLELLLANDASVVRA